MFLFQSIFMLLKFQTLKMSFTQLVVPKKRREFSPITFPGRALCCHWSHSQFGHHRCVLRCDLGPPDYLTILCSHTHSPSRSQGEQMLSSFIFDFYDTNFITCLHHHYYYGYYLACKINFSSWASGNRTPVNAVLSFGAGSPVSTPGDGTMAPILI